MCIEVLDSVYLQLELYGTLRAFASSSSAGWSESIEERGEATERKSALPLRPPEYGLTQMLTRPIPVITNFAILEPL